MKRDNVILLKSPQTITDLGVTKIVDLIVGDSNATQHLRGGGARLSVARTNIDDSSLADLVIAAPHADTDGVVSTSETDYTAQIDWEWRDTSSDAYKATGGKFYDAAPSSDQELLTASSWNLVTGDTGNDKLAGEVAKFQWELLLQHQQSPSTVPSALQTEIEAGMKAFADPIVDSSAGHVTSSTLYAFLNTAAGSTPLRVASPIHDGTDNWTVTTTLSRDRTNHPHRFTINVSFDGPDAGTAATGLFIGVGAIDDNPRKIIYGEQISLTINEYSATFTYDFSDA